jgi:hypothetical protein
LMAGFISISGHSLTRRNTVSRGTGLPDSALGHPSGSFRPTRPTLGHADATQRSRESPRSGTDDLATLLGISVRRVTQLVEKKVLLREARGTFDVCDSVHRFIAHRETVVAQEHGVGAYGKARAQQAMPVIGFLHSQSMAPSYTERFNPPASHQGSPAWRAGCRRAAVGAPRSGRAPCCRDRLPDDPQTARAGCGPDRRA